MEFISIKIEPLDDYEIQSLNTVTEPNARTQVPIQHVYEETTANTKSTLFATNIVTNHMSNVTSNTQPINLVTIKTEPPEHEPSGTDVMTSNKDVVTSNTNAVTSYKDVVTNNTDAVTSDTQPVNLVTIKTEPLDDVTSDTGVATSNTHAVISNTCVATSNTNAVISNTDMVKNNSDVVTSNTNEFAFVTVKSEPIDDTQNEPEFCDVNHYLEVELKDGGHIKEEKKAPNSLNPLNKIQAPPVEINSVQVGYTFLNNRFNCNFCVRSYARLSNMIMHLKKHADKLNSNECPICLKNFKDSQTRDSHLVVHSEETPYQCNRCLRAFRVQSLLEKHIKLNFCRQLEDLTCKICNKTYTYYAVYKSHMVKHESDRPHKCDICGAMFKHKCAVTRHMLIHNGERKFKCTHCPKSYYLQGLLDTHMKTHTELRPYECTVCLRSFKLKHTLKKHMKTHAREKKLVCDVCDKKFPKESRLKYHMRVHTQEKKFVCDVCKRHFSHKQNVLRHMVAKHPWTMHPEFVANFKFNY